MKTRSEVAAERSNPAYERDMNPEQLAAIRHERGPCVLLATAGSGKTRAVVHRIARLVARKIATADRILAVTFSKKAADEMNARLEVLGITEARVGTFHSLCLQVIKDDRTTWASWKIDDKDAAKWIVKEVLGYRKANVPGHLGLDWKGADLTKVLGFITICKANLWTSETPEAMELARERFGTMRDQVGRPSFTLALEAYSRSQSMIEERQLLTFDDMLVFAHRHLSSPEVRDRWASKWDQAIQDEAQDANVAQTSIMSLLASEHRNYMIVGDVAQSIYSFRGSTPKLLANFAKEWNAPTIVMNRNYRSGRAIVALANDIIRPAEIRLPVDMLCERDHAGVVKIHGTDNQEHEAHELGAMIDDHRKDGKSLSDITVLYRLNAQSRATEEELLKRKIPYLIVGGTSFYDRREVKDLLSYLRVAAEIDHEVDAVKRCINSPYRFLGQAFVERVSNAGSPGCDWAEVVSEVATQDRLQARQRGSALEWASLVRGIRSQMRDGTKPAEILSNLVRTTRYIEWIEKEEGQESVESSGGANVREIIRVAERFESVDTLLNYIAEQQRAAKRQRRDKQAGGDRVLLMSGHRSKGLEFPIVWVLGCNEMVLPHHRGDVEEERRIAYVMATRARDVLVMSYVREMSTRAGVTKAKMSRFLPAQASDAPAPGRRDDTYDLETSESAEE